MAFFGFLMFVLSVGLTTTIPFSNNDNSINKSTTTYTRNQRGIQTRCNECSPFGPGKDYPECLRYTKTCRQGHVCTIIYKPDVPLSSFLTMGCTTQCLNYRSNESSRCGYGGNITTANTCFDCCKHNSCVNKFIKAATGTGGGSHTTAITTTTTAPRQHHSAQGTRLYCPGSCRADDLSACRSHGYICSDGKFCNLAFDLGAGRFQGMCAENSLLSTCHEYNRDHHCPVPLDQALSFLSSHSNLYGYCYYGCCQDNSCVLDVMIPKPTTTIQPITTPTTTLITSTTTPTTTTTTPTTTSTTPTTTTTTPTTTTLSEAKITTKATTKVTPTRTSSSTHSSPATTLTTSPTSTFNYSSLMTSCQDKLKGSTCPTLRIIKNICHSPYGLSLCPDTCNICQVVKSVVCEDKTVSKDCVSLSSNPSFCQDEMAIYICAKTCGLCNKLVQSVVDEVLFASPTPDFNKPMTTPPTLHCPELLQSDCQHVRDVCIHSNLHDICPTECRVCS